MRNLSFIVYCLVLTISQLEAQYPGSQDFSLVTQNCANDYIWASAIQPIDNKILVGGEFTKYGYDQINRVARLFENGLIDTSFHVGDGTDDDVYCFLPQADGKIMMGGKFNYYNNQFVGGIVRLNEDGTLDPTFQNNLGVNGQVWTIEVQPDGKYLVGGDFSSYGGNLIRSIMRINVDGSIDNTFTSKVPNSWVRAIEIQPDGKIIFGGDFTVYDAKVVNHIVRVHPDGSFDNTFMSGIGFDDLVRDMEHLPDGRIYITGGFDNYNGTPQKDIVRIYPDGTIDGTFNIGTGPKGWILTCSIRSDGKIFIGGDFTEISGKDLFRLACLLEDGSLDPSFDSGYGPNNTVRNVHALPNGKALITGNFLTYNEKVAERICLVNAAPLGTSISEPSPIAGIAVYPNPVGQDEYVYFDAPNEMTVRITDLSGRLIDTINFSTSIERKIKVADLQNGVYFLEFIQGSMRSSTRIIKR